MKKEQTIRAWKDTEYRNLLGKKIEEMPEHPTGWANLSDLQLGGVFGGLDEAEAIGTGAGGTFGCCTYWRVCDGLNTNYFRTYGCCPNTSGY